MELSSLAQTRESIKELEQELSAFDFSSIASLIPRYLINYEQRLPEVKETFQQSQHSNEQK